MGRKKIVSLQNKIEETPKTKIKPMGKIQIKKTMKVSLHSQIISSFTYSPIGN